MSGGRNVSKKKRIVILCEGDTELNAVRYFIRPQWERDNLQTVGLKAVNLNGQTESVFKLTPKFSEEEQTKAIFTIVDLYGLKRNMYNPQDNLSTKINKLKHWLEDKFEDSVLIKYHPHLAVHETEAWFLTEDNKLGEILGKQIKGYKNSESINTQNHPSKRIKALFLKHLKRSYKKGGLNGDDRKLFERMNLSETSEKCPYLKAFYEDLKQTAQKHI